MAPNALDSTNHFELKSVFAFAALAASTCHSTGVPVRSELATVTAGCSGADGAASLAAQDGNQGNVAGVAALSGGRKRRRDGETVCYTESEMCIIPNSSLLRCMAAEDVAAQPASVPSDCSSSSSDSAALPAYPFPGHQNRRCSVQTSIRNAILRQGFAPNHRRALLRLAAAKIADLPGCPKKATALRQLRVRLLLRPLTHSHVFCDILFVWGPAALLPQTPMAGSRKWGRRSKLELKLVWLVIEELYGDVLHPEKNTRPVYFAAEGATVEHLVSSLHSLMIRLIERGLMFTRVSPLTCS